MAPPGSPRSSATSPATASSRPSPPPGQGTCCGCSCGSSAIPPRPSRSQRPDVGHGPPEEFISALRAGLRHRGGHPAVRPAGHPAAWPGTTARSSSAPPGPADARPDGTYHSRRSRLTRATSALLYTDGLAAGDTAVRRGPHRQHAAPLDPASPRRAVQGRSLEPPGLRAGRSPTTSPSSPSAGPDGVRGHHRWGGEPEQRPPFPVSGARTTPTTTGARSPVGDRAGPGGQRGQGGASWPPEQALRAGPPRSCSTRARSSRTPARQHVRRRTCPPTAGHGHRRDRRAHGSVVANDPTVKAGSWGARTVEDGPATEPALQYELPIFWLIDSRRRPHHRPGRAVPRPARRRPDLLQPGEAVGRVPQICCLFGPVMPAAPTSRRSATSSSWSRATPRCTWARPAWPRWSSERGRDRSRRWAAPACTPPSPAAATTWRSTTPRRAGPPGSRTSRPLAARTPAYPGRPNRPGAHRDLVPDEERRATTCTT